MGMLISDKLKLPFISTDNTPKPNHKGKNKVIVIEDHISTGLSSMKAIDDLKSNGYEILGLISNTTYGLDTADKLFKNNDIHHHSICSFENILKTATKLGIISKEEDVKFD